MHEDGRATYGHSLVVDPWGEILLDAGDAPGLHVVDLPLERIADVRARIPVLRHRRPIARVAIEELGGGMISFDLKCAAGHVFEAWFKSSEALCGPVATRS